ncbi:MAG: FG-GAP repeat protein [Dehalococcoidia bacterium]|nr:FG-GAP repeat protein [Dehalococcoidia bacterium]
MSIRRQFIATLACLIAVLALATAYESPQDVHPLNLAADDTTLRAVTLDQPVPAGLDWTPAPTQYNWTAESNQASAYFGYSVANAGDVNGDGYDDIIVGAYCYDNEEADEGRAYVYHGSASGLSTAPDWTAESNQAGAYFGYSAATAGDVNGDGYDDIIVGAYCYDNGETDEGRAYVYHGSASGLSTAPNWTAESNQAGAYFGYSAANAGDVNGDGYDDVIIGAPEDDVAYVYHGSATGLSTSPNWTATEGFCDDFGSSVGEAGDVNGDSYDDVIIGAPGGSVAYAYHGSATGLSTSPNWTASEAFWYELGSSVGGIGDVNGDGYDDVIIGAPGEDLAYVYHGSAAGLSASYDWHADSEEWSAEFGGSVASAGDVNGDGYADVIVGEQYCDNGHEEEGRAYVFHGSSMGLSATVDWTADSDQEGAWFGCSVASAGDVNGDGYDDTIAGAYGYDNEEFDEGRAYVYHGAAIGLPPAPRTIYVPDQFPTIQAAVIGAGEYDEGDTIIVRDGVYAECVDIDYPGLTIVSEHGPAVTSVVGYFDLGEGNVTVSGFAVTNSSGCGIHIEDCHFAGEWYDNCTVAGNIILGGGPSAGIVIDSLQEEDGSHTVAGNSISGFETGIDMEGSGNVITGNTIVDVCSGIILYDGQNQITGNTIVNSGGYGIHVDPGWKQQDVFNNVIDSTNTVNGKPVYYYYSQSDLVLGGLDTTHLTLAYCSNITVANSNISNGDGVYLYESCGNTFSGNVICSNNEDGVYLFYSENNRFVNNNVSFNENDGFLLHWDANHNQITGNTVASNNGNGMEMWGYNGDNLIEDNRVLSSGDDGMWLFYSFRNIIRGNSILDGTDFGIYLTDYSGYNLIYHNNLIDNVGDSSQAADWSPPDGITPTTNCWDNGSVDGGNYWNDHTCTGNPSNGSQPYHIEGWDGNYPVADRYPFQDPSGWAPSANPSVTTLIASDVTSASAILEGYLVSLGSASSVEVSFEWGPTPSYGNETTPQTMTDVGAFTIELSALSPGVTYHFRAKAVGDGTAYGDDLRFTTPAMIIPPALLSPANGAILNHGTPTLDWSDVSDIAVVIQQLQMAQESTLSAMTYHVQVDDNAEFSSPVRDEAGLSISEYTLTEALADGIYYWRVRAEDDAIGESPWTSPWSFTLSNEQPVVVALSPSQGAQVQALTVVISGLYFGRVTSVDFGAGITVNSFSLNELQFNGLDQITVNITIDSDATPGVRDVLVTTPAGTGVKALGFTVAGSTSVLKPPGDQTDQGSIGFGAHADLALRRAVAE